VAAFFYSATWLLAEIADQVRQRLMGERKWHKLAAWLLFPWGLVAAEIGGTVGVEEQFIIKLSVAPLARFVAAELGNTVVDVHFHDGKRLEQAGNAASDQASSIVEVSGWDRLRRLEGELPQATPERLNVASVQACGPPGLWVGDVKGLPAIIGSPLSESLQEGFGEGHRSLLRF
jgi:hypothetical protein